MQFNSLYIWLNITNRNYTKPLIYSHNKYSSAYSPHRFIRSFAAAQWLTSIENQYTKLKENKNNNNNSKQQYQHKMFIQIHANGIQYNRNIVMLYTTVDTSLFFDCVRVKWNLKIKKNERVQQMENNYNTLKITLLTVELPFGVIQ